ncbi:MAG: thioredoxin domain-containing protein [Alphaproteobacteria bacterium]|nr:thioredoxin domain-containing protein [Alphaproteobacteria bacterium]
MTQRINHMLMVFGMITDISAAPKLDACFTISYGNPKAPIHIVEYFSFGCVPCIEMFANEFEGILEKYITPGLVYWVFQPHPVDLITVQAMVCLEALADQQKRVFLEAVLLEHNQSPEFGLLKLMLAAMDVLTIRIPDVTDGSVLQSTPAFKAAFSYQQANPTFTGTPTISINGTIVDEFPTRSLIDDLIQNEQGTPR